MPAKPALVSHSSPGHGVLKAFYSAVVAFAGGRFGGLLAVVLNQFMQLVAACIQRASKVQGNVGRVVSLGLAEFV